MNKDNIEGILKDIGAEQVPEDIKKIAQQTSNNFSRQLAISQKTKSHILLEHIMKRKIGKFAAAALIIILVFTGLNQFGGSTVAWSNVVKKFQSVEFFNAAIYFKENITSESVQIELWMNQDGKIRLLAGKQVVFAENSEIIKTFDIQEREEVEVDERATFLIKKLASTGGFSLETVLNALSDDNLQEITPLINSDAIISQDIVVFDIQPTDLQWFRIWALRESKLPIRIRMWTPRNGESVDVVFSYSKQQPDEFFDPQAFIKAMADRQLDEVNLAYMFLEDFAQKKISPTVPDEQKAFKIITQTVDGKPWSLGDYKGKDILLIFWSDRIRTLEKLKEIYEEFGERDDFVMVGVNLDPEVERVKAYCEREEVKWLQLHEPTKPWKNQNGMIIGEPENKLAKALGITLPTVVMVRKDGIISKIDRAFLDDGVKAMLSDIMFCPSQEWFNETITRKGKDNGNMTQDEIIKMFGKPHSIEQSVNDGQIWKYEAFMEEWSLIVLLTIHYDNTGKIVGVGNRT